MSRAALPLLAVFLCTLATVSADFVVIQKEESLGQQTTTTIKIKGDQVRIDGDPRASLLLNGATGGVTMLVPAIKLFMKMNDEQIKEAKTVVAKKLGTAGGAKLDIKATGKKDNISGYDVEEYIMRFGSVVFRTWVAKDYPNAEAIQEAMNMETLKEFLGLGGIDLPTNLGMSIKTLVEAGNLPPTTILLESAKEQFVDPAEFKVPADYKEMPATPGR